MIRGFKDFLLRGNVIDLAVAVVIGAAFATIVSAFTDRVIKPLINAVTPADNPGLGFTIVAGKATTYVDIGALISAALNFVIVAAVVYFVIVVPLNRFEQRRELKQEPAEPAAPTDVQLLTEIRDLLRDQPS